eukprot:5470500-Alexandrium_andersonii.AAC.1
MRARAHAHARKAMPFGRSRCTGLATMADSPCGHKQTPSTQVHGRPPQSGLRNGRRTSSGRAPAERRDAPPLRRPNTL